MTRAILIALACIPLAACGGVTSGGITKADIDAALAAWTGDKHPAAFVADFAAAPSSQVSSSSEASSSSSAECINYTWRGRVYACDGTWLYDL
jgi:hypothetical protein